jgi:hypothetical protein
VFLDKQRIRRKCQQSRVQQLSRNRKGRGGGERRDEREGGVSKAL